MAAFLFGYEPRYRAISATGAPIPGAKLRFSVSPGTTPTDSYTTSDLTTANSDPVVADSGGLFPPIFLSSEVVYRVRLYTSADVLVWDQIDYSQSNDLTQSEFNAYYALTDDRKRTPAEIAAGVTPTDFSIENHISSGRVIVNRYGTDSAAITNAIAVAQEVGLVAVYMLPATFTMSSKVTISDTPIALLAEEFSPLQQGSTRPAVTLRWTGGASAMFACEVSGCSFVGFAVENFGSATDFLENTTGSQQHNFRRLSFMVGSGASIFSNAILSSTTNGFGYSVFDQIYCLGAAPAFLKIDGNGSSNGLTPITFQNRCLFESNDASALNVVQLIDVQCDQLIIKDSTFNAQSATNELCIVDTTGTPANPAITSMTFENNEFDSVSTTSGHRMMKLTNVRNCFFSGNALQGGGTVTALVELVNSIVVTGPNWAERIGGPIFNCDSTSRVYPSANNIKAANTAGISSDPGAGKAGGVLQVVNVVMNTQRTTTSASYDPISGLTANITPLCETSKILVFVNVTGIDADTTARILGFNLTRNASQIIEFDLNANRGASGVSYVDAPTSVSALTYAVSFKTSGGTAYVAKSGSACTITLMELAG